MRNFEDLYSFKFNFGMSQDYPIPEFVSNLKQYLRQKLGLYDVEIKLVGVAPTVSLIGDVNVVMRIVSVEITIPHLNAIERGREFYDILKDYSNPNATLVTVW